ncbi:MAG: thioredoxin family protein [Hyphomicrobiaceae bacterium]
MALLRDGTHSSDFTADLAGGGVVLAEIYTPDCIICKRMEPMVAALEANMGGEIAAYKIDAARDPAFAERYDVRGLPTVLLFKNGQITDRRTGFLTMSMLKDWIAPFLGAKTA